MIKEDGNDTDIMDNTNGSEQFNGLKIVQLLIASMGVITNIIVVTVFLKDRKLRRKVPNICIINQVGTVLSNFFSLKTTSRFSQFIRIHKANDNIQCLNIFVLEICRHKIRNKNISKYFLAQFLLMQYQNAF